jgi:hypothetical protein
MVPLIRSEAILSGVASGLARAPGFNMKDDTLTKRDFICLVLIAIAVLVLGLMESAQNLNPNH